MKYKRILIKLSGEMLGSKGEAFSFRAALTAAEEIKSIVSKGLEVAILVGGGNIMRARDNKNMSRISADYMGMTATVINALGLKDALTGVGVESVIFSALKVEGITEVLSAEKAVKCLKEKKVVIFAGGTGAPYFTTDTAAVLRALEIKADILLKATKVEGLYSADPAKDKRAKILRGNIPLRMVIEKKLKIMDAAAFQLLYENNLGVIIFDFNKKGNLKKVIEGKAVGTVIGG